MDVISERFKRLFHKIDEKDYEKARKWVEFHIEQMKKSNNIEL